MLAFTVLIYFGFSKGGVTSKPKQSEPLPVTPDQRLYNVKYAVGRMYIATSEFRCQTITLAGEAEYRMIAIRPEVTVIS